MLSSEIKNKIQSGIERRLCTFTTGFSTHSANFLFLSKSKWFLGICNTFRIKELSENSREEAQVARNIICHGRGKRFHNGVNTKHSLKKLKITLEAVAKFRINLREGLVVVVVLVVWARFNTLLARNVHGGGRTWLLGGPEPGVLELVLLLLVVASPWCWW